MSFITSFRRMNGEPAGRAYFSIVGCNNVPVMKKSNREVRPAVRFGGNSFCRGMFPSPTEIRFESGDIYLFHRSDPHCPAESSLWGQFDKWEGTFVYLESSTTDHLHFRVWHRLPKGYFYCRRSTRNEFRDYIASRTVREMFELPGRTRDGLCRRCPGRSLRT